MSIIIRDMTKDDEYYVGTCTHVYENNNEREESCPRRISWLRSMEKHGLRVKVALLDGVHAGFIYLMPIEVNPWQIQGRDLMVFPCLVSHFKFSTSIEEIESSIPCSNPATSSSGSSMFLPFQGAYGAFLAIQGDRQKHGSDRNQLTF